MTSKEGHGCAKDRHSQPAATLVAKWWRRTKAIDIVIGAHAVTQGADRYFGGNEATIRYCKELFAALPEAAMEKITGWYGFSGQPLAERSIFLRDLTHEVSMPLVFNRRGDKVVVQTVMVKTEQQRIIPCGGESRMSLILDYDGSRVVSKLRIGRLFYADTQENRAIPYRSPAELSANSKA